MAKEKNSQIVAGIIQKRSQDRACTNNDLGGNLIEEGTLRIIRVHHFATNLMENKGYETLLTFAVFSELRRRHTHDAFEALDEVVGRVESQPVGYFRDGEPGGFQEQFGAGDLGLADIA